MAMLMANLDNKEFVCLMTPAEDYDKYLFLYKGDLHYYLYEVD